MLTFSHPQDALDMTWQLGNRYNWQIFAGTMPILRENFKRWKSLLLVANLANTK